MSGKLPFCAMCGFPEDFYGDQKKYEFISSLAINKIIPEQLYGVIIDNCSTDDKGQLIPLSKNRGLAVMNMKGSEIIRLLEEGHTFS